MIVFKMEKECREARDVESKKDVTYVKAELANAKKALRVLKFQASRDRFAMLSVI